MRCPTCGRFVSPKHPCSKCWQYAGAIRFTTATTAGYDDMTFLSTTSLPIRFIDMNLVGATTKSVALWRRVFRLLKSIICLGGGE